MIVSSPEYLEKLFEESRSELLAFFLRRFRCRETAADLAQETYLRLYQSTREKNADNPRALAFRIATNLAIDHQRRQSYRSRFECDIGDESAGDAPCSRPGPDRVVDAQQDLAQLDAALAELPDGSRLAVMLSGVEGLTYAQIAVRLGVSERMVARRIAKALQHCRDRCDHSHGN